VNTVVITNFYYRTPMTHSMPSWLRRLFLHILPRILWMESPKLQEKRDELELSSTVDTIEQAVILQNPFHTLNETIHTSQKTKSKHADKVIFIND
jgi:hypothetical protein